MKYLNCKLIKCKKPLDGSIYSLTCCFYSCYGCLKKRQAVRNIKPVSECLNLHFISCPTILVAIGETQVPQKLYPLAGSSGRNQSDPGFCKTCKLPVFKETMCKGKEKMRKNNVPNLTRNSRLCSC